MFILIRTMMSIDLSLKRERERKRDVIKGERETKGMTKNGTEKV